MYRTFHQGKLDAEHMARRLSEDHHEQSKVFFVAKLAQGYMVTDTAPIDYAHERKLFGSLSAEYLSRWECGNGPFVVMANPVVMDQCAF